MNAYTVESETEHCPFCGKPIVYGHTELMGVYYSQPLECPCVTEKKAMERAARIAEGREIVRNNMREYSGLSKRASGRDSAISSRTTGKRKRLKLHGVSPRST